MLLSINNHSHPESSEICTTPRQLLLLILAGWINHREQEVIEYLRAENRVLGEKLGERRICWASEYLGLTASIKAFWE
jgi:hypothetical protein